MVSHNDIRSSLEDLPNELFLFICQFLSSADVLLCFYGLNHRISQTISGYYRHVVIGQIPYEQFNHLCALILPEIGINISSLVVSNQWKGILSNCFLDYFADKMSLTFPQLKTLSLISFNVDTCESFLSSLENLFEFDEIRLYYQYDSTNDSLKCEALLQKIFETNNQRLNSILFDNHSIVFSLKTFNSRLTYSNITKLSIDLATIDDLHRLLTLLPQLISLIVTLNEDSPERTEMNHSNENQNLQEFRLQSFGPSWTFHELSSLIARLPCVKHLSFASDCYTDEQLLNGEKILPLISHLSLRTFRYFLQFYDVTSSIDEKMILSTWHEFTRQVICFKNNETKAVVLFTLPFDFPYVFLRNSIAKNEVFAQNYASQVEVLSLYGVSSTIDDIFPILKQSRRLKTLALQINEYAISRKIEFSKFLAIFSFIF